MRQWLVGAGVMTALFTEAGPLDARKIPYFARKYDVACSQCHVSPPKLNAFGEGFLARGYDMPGVPVRRTWPFALWISARGDSPPPGQSAVDGVRAYLNRIEVISGGKVIAPWLSYFVEWRPLSQELRSSGTLRDRSGRFEDIFVTAIADRLDVTIGQFRQIAQVDVSRRLGVSEPLVLSASLAGSGGGTTREQSLRAFAPAGRSPSIRVGWNESVLGSWRWTTSAALPLAGELSIPLTDEARTEASNEIELRAKGVILESYVRSGVTSFGGHVFYDDAQRYLAHAVTAGARGDLYWTVLAGVARTGGVTRGRWSLEAELVPHTFFAFGTRVEDQAADPAKVAVLPYINAHFPGTRFTMRLTAERRFQEGRNATFVELGTVF